VLFLRTFLRGVEDFFAFTSFAFSRSSCSRS